MNSAKFRVMAFRCLIAASVWFVPSIQAESAELATKRLKIFVLAGQSNMVGHARAHTIATLAASDDPRDRELLDLVFQSGKKPSQNHLNEMLELGRSLDQMTGGVSMDKLGAVEPGPKKESLEKKVDELKQRHDLYKKSMIDGCVTSDRVYIASIAGRNIRSGKLGVGFGNDEIKIGPEYGFGLPVARQVDGPILLIKASWGGKSINYDFRPPSAEPYQLSEKEQAGDKAEQIRSDAGKYYRLMMEHIDEVVGDLSKHHPLYEAEAGHEFCGFVWFQGFNDQFREDFRENYKCNMVRFIQDVRKDCGAPEMPFVIGVLGTGVTEEKVAENEVSL
ncbi:MAG: sialate O-acetylesterase, partial [Planctomycetota bacterium]